MAKILLVEDNEMNRDMLKRRLERRGHEVSIAVDGAKGVEKATSETPDIILMDLNLPVLDGWEATRRIKANDETSGIPVIALTAHAMAGDQKKALEAGCDDYDTTAEERQALKGHVQAVLQKGEYSRDGLLTRIRDLVTDHLSASPSSDN
jgi:two-component system cell cycle response regulator DivK